MIELRGLGYIVVESTDIAAWRHYGEQVLGMMVLDVSNAGGNAAGGGLSLKMDERAGRIHVTPGARDGYLASGWELAGEQAYLAAQDSLRQRDIAFHIADSATCALRHVQQMLWVSDPSGNRHELYWGVKTDFGRFVSPVGVSGFVTGELGLGHVVLPAPDLDSTYAFLKDVLGFSLSDMFRMRFTPDPAEPEKRIYFLHCANGRHHSLGIFEMPAPSGCIHAMVEVQSMDEVGRALDRVRQHGVKMSATLGRHCNDRMTSFYMKTPGGFDMEYGHGGLVVDWDRHSVYEATAVSLWGHDFSVGFQ